MEQLVGTLTALGGLVGTLSQPEQTPVPPYQGVYTVTPRLSEQSLATMGLRMTDDVTVYEIPVVYTTNTHGGKTVVIG